jgi:hypothetical protein
MKKLLTAFILAALTAASASEPAKSPAPPVPAGAYTLDKAHASLLFRVNHIGFSNYTGRFSKFDAELRFDPATPTASHVTVTIDPRSLGLENPPAGFIDSLLGAQWLDTARFPEMRFRSRSSSCTALNARSFWMPPTMAAMRAIPWNLARASAFRHTARSNDRSLEFRTGFRSPALRWGSATRSRSSSRPSSPGRRSLEG